MISYPDEFFRETARFVAVARTARPGTGGVGAAAGTPSDPTPASFQPMPGSRVAMYDTTEGRRLFTVLTRADPGARVGGEVWQVLPDPAPPRVYSVLCPAVDRSLGDGVLWGTDLELVV